MSTLMSFDHADGALTMHVDLLNIAKNIYQLANNALDNKSTQEAYQLFEMSIASAFMAGADTPIEFKLLPKHLLKIPVVTPEHVVVVLEKNSVKIQACSEFITSPIFTFERFPVIGDVFSGASHQITDNNAHACVADLSDGCDFGTYKRVAFCSSRNDTALIPDPFIYYYDNYDQYRHDVARHAAPWLSRENVIFWRGESNGQRLKPPDPQDPSNWECQQRLRLCAAARDSAYPDMLDVALTKLQTIEEDYLKRSIEAAGFLKAPVDKHHFLNYRYQIDVDGWTNAWSLLDKLISGSTILKVQSALGYRQWFYDKLVPWENYIPVDADVSDLDQIIEWISSHTDQCERVAQSGRQMAETVQLRPDLEKAQNEIMRILQPLDP